MRIKEVSVDQVTEGDSVFQLVIFALMGVLVALALFLLVGRVFATAPAPYKVICHHTPANQVTLSFQNIQSWLGHLGTPHSGSTYDTNGACVQPTATPTVEPTPTVTPLPDFCPEEGYQPYGPCQEEVTPTPEPEVTPEPTPVDTHGSNVGDAPLTNNTTNKPSCADLSVPEVPTIWVTDGTPSDGVLNVQWGTNQYNKVDIRYSDDSNMDKYSLLNTENDGYEAIGALHIGTHYNFQVRFRNGCSTGSWSNSYDPRA